MERSLAMTPPESPGWSHAESGAGIGENGIAGSGGNGLRRLPAASEIWRWALPGLDRKPVVRWVCRSLLAGFGHRVVGIEGMEHLEARHDPFIVALNHNQRPESVLIPAWLLLLRRGRMVHFFQDWNFQLIPGIGQLLRLNEPILVVRKDARPRFLNALRPWLVPKEPAWQQAVRRIREGASLGIFPEGTVNRCPDRLLRGLTGAARLSLETGAPVVPVGVRFPFLRPGARIEDGDRLTVHVGPPLKPEGGASPDPTPGAIRAWHRSIMSAISRLSGKSWSEQHARTKNVH